MALTSPQLVSARRRLSRGLLALGVRRPGGVTARFAARVLRTTEPNVRSHARELENAGLITRLRLHRDRRGQPPHVYVLTKHGREAAILIGARLPTTGDWTAARRTLAVGVLEVSDRVDEPTETNPSEVLIELMGRIPFGPDEDRATFRIVSIGER
jgi:DNA-binding transcriptional ArsR family regulator